MAFCKYCGKELEENQLCDCEKAVSSRQTEQAVEVQNEGMAVAEKKMSDSQANNQTTNNLLEVAKTTWKTIWGILKAPEINGKEFAQNGKNIIAYIVLALQAVVASVFACLIIGKINGIIDLAGSYLQSIKFSGFTAFVVTFLFSILLSVVMAGVVCCVMKILKATCSFTKSMRMLAVRTIGILPIMILAIVFFALNVGFGIVVFITSSVLGFCFLINALNTIEELSGNKKTYVLFVLVIAYVALYALLASKGISLYIPETLKAYIGEISSLPDLIVNYFGDFL